jgi:hypothetical protein
MRPIVNEGRGVLDTPPEPNRIPNLKVIGTSVPSGSLN